QDVDRHMPDPPLRPVLPAEAGPLVAPVVEHRVAKLAAPRGSQPRQPLADTNYSVSQDVSVVTGALPCPRAFLRLKVTSQLHVTFFSPERQV
ncbi:MAG: hypothetical protein QOH30_2566, partial [Baekduia sp.]|nr:hypothetical protein [Baekduia sp.]